jgi:hypothetical protein
MITGTQRPKVEFCAADPQHRKWARAYLETGSWSRCPVQFQVPVEYREVPYYISKEISRFYLVQDTEIQE